MGHLNHKLTRRTVRRLITNLEELMTASFDRLTAALDGLTGDIARPLVARAESLDADTPEA